MHRQQPQKKQSSGDLPDGGENVLYDQLEGMKKLLDCPESKIIIESIRDEDILMFIGNTKSGKSTLVNHVIGNELIALINTNSFSNTLSIAKVNAGDAGPVIGLECVSETTLPTVWSAEKSGIREKVVDAPGFEDNRGEVQDIANAFYIKEIIRNAKSIKFVLVTDIGDISGDNIGSFTTFIDKIDKIFPENRVLNGGIVLVFTKADNNASSQKVCAFFTNSILKQEKMALPKSLIRYFVHNKEAIAFFYKPTSEGRINESNIGKDLLNVIEDRIIGIPSEELGAVKPGVSDKSHIFLLKLHSKLCDVAEYIRMLERLKEGFSRNTVEIYKVESMNEVTKIDETLEDFDRKIKKLMSKNATELSLSQVLLYIRNLGDICGIESLSDDDNIDIKLQFVNFVDETLGLNLSESYRTTFQITLGSIVQELQSARLQAATRLQRMTAAEAERQRKVLEEKHQEELRKNEKKMRKLNEENEAKVKKQLSDMGVLDHLGEAGMKLFNTVCGWFK